MKRKALEKLESIAKRRPSKKTIKDLPLELIQKISKYDNPPFIPRKDIGPLAPADILSVDATIPIEPNYLGLMAGYLKSKDNILRASEKGPITRDQDWLEKHKITEFRKAQLQRELDLVNAIFGPSHPSIASISERRSDII